MAGGKTVTTTVKNIVEPVIEGLGIELVDVEYVKEGSSWYLRLYIDKPGGISIDDCQLVHENVTDLIDEADPIEGAYIFEVSSPGLDRPLKTEKDIKRNIGELVELSLYAPDVEGNKNYTGRLYGCTPETVTLQEEERDKTRIFNMKAVSLIKKVIIIE